MKLNRNRFALLFACQAALLLAVGAGMHLLTADRAEAQGAGGAGLNVAVCDVALIFEEYDRAADLTGEFDQYSQELMAEDQQRQQNIETMRTELNMLSPGSDLYESKLEEIQSAAVEREVWRRVTEQTMMRRRNALMQEMYDDVIAMIEQVADEQGLELVLYRDEVDLASGSYAELLTKITQRKVLYNDPSLDITATVLTRLDQQYQAGR